ncbi:MAG: formate dehydrogenase accessory sulfurtransferase FdhD [Actinomycetota bacterium]
MSTQPRPGPTVRATPLVVQDGTARPRSDVLVAEEPLEIRVNVHGVDHPISVTMRTPSSDFELAVGFLYTEGIIRSRDDVDQVRYCVGGPVEQQYNIVTVALRPGVAFDAESVKRNFYTTSSCGICGRASLEALAINAPPPIPEGPVVDANLIASLPEKLRKGQKIFEQTGGLHAAGLFEPDGTLVTVREDVGRHNAVDKLVGLLVMEGKVPTGERILVVSGRASFEIMQKALAAGIPIVAAVSAPSSLAVATAEEFGMTLAGFVRGESLNVYAGAQRIRVTAGTTTETGKR